MGFTQCKNHQTVSQKKEFPTIPSEYLVKNSLKKTGGHREKQNAYGSGCCYNRKASRFYDHLSARLIPDSYRFYTLSKLVQIAPEAAITKAPPVDSTQKIDRKKEEANLFKRHGAIDVRVAMVNNATDMCGSLVFICIQFGKNLIILLKALFHDQAHSCQENMYLNVDQRQEYRWKVAYSLQSKGVGRKTSQNPT